MTKGPLRPNNLCLRANYPGARRNLNINQNLNREPWFATINILNSVELDVNPVFRTLKDRSRSPVPCPNVQVGERQVLNALSPGRRAPEHQSSIKNYTVL